MRARSLTQRSKSSTLLSSYSLYRISTTCRHALTHAHLSRTPLNTAVIAALARHVRTKSTPTHGKVNANTW
eukprot:1344388-Rhodomonas_salina.2